MQKNIVKKGFVVAIIFLFIHVSFQPIIAKDTFLPEKKSSIIKIDNSKELLLGTILNIANNQEIQNIVQKYENKKSLLGFQHLKVNLQEEIIGVIGKNDEINERIKQLSDLPCDCENDNNPLWYPKILCTFLLIIYIYASYCYLFYGLGEKLANICLTIMHLINCPY